MRRGVEAEEELGPVRVFTAVRHAQDATLGVYMRKILVSETFTVDRLTTSAIAAREVATLGHETGDDPVKLAILEVKGLT